MSYGVSGPSLVATSLNAMQVRTDMTSGTESGEPAVESATPVASPPSVCCSVVGVSGASGPPDDPGSSPTPLPWSFCVGSASPGDPNASGFTQ